MLSKGKKRGMSYVFKKVQEHFSSHDKSFYVGLKEISTVLIKSKQLSG